MACPSHKPSEQDATGKPAGEKRARFWRSLSEWQESSDFDQYLHREFPVAASEFPSGVSRRRWLQIMGASLAMAGTAGCRYPEEMIAPFVLRPEGRVPGERYDRATNIELAGRVYHLLVSCVDGRPLKIESNMDHPSGGCTDVFSQASILSLYDPDRSRGDDGPALKAAENGRRFAASWEDFSRYGQALIRTAESNGSGKSMAVMVGPTSSPSLVRMLESMKKRLPEMTLVRQDAVTGGVMAAATELALGKPARQVLDLSSVKVVVALQADILGNDPGFMTNAASFCKTRDPDHGKMSRLYVVEGGFTQTGAAADARVSLRPSEMPAFLAEVGRRVEALSSGGEQDRPEATVPYDQVSHGERLERFLHSVAHDLVDAGSDAVVVVGEHLGAEAVAAGIHLNKKLGSLGKAQTFTSLVDSSLADSSSASELVDKINAG
ncbi:MAG: TAT-variant-translocated molybdopterin oxidoreductase, partial [Planctomycetota bacterium]